MYADTTSSHWSLYTRRIPCQLWFLARSWMSSDLVVVVSLFVSSRRDWPRDCGLQLANVTTNGNTRIWDIDYQLFRSLACCKQNLIPMMPERRWGYSDRRFCCYGCRSTSVVCDTQQQWQWLVCPFHNVVLARFTWSSSATTKYIRSSNHEVRFSAAHHHGWHGRTMKTCDAWRLHVIMARQIT